MSKYSVTTRDGCTLITGDIPVAHFAALVDLAGPDAELSPYLAQLSGASSAWGSPNAVAALINTLKTQGLRAVAHGSDVDKWMATGQHGLSSLSIVQHLTGRNVAHREGLDIPYDPDDLKRCRLLLEACPSLVPEFPRMVTASPTWARLVAIWPDLCATMDEEAPEWRDGKGSAPKTYAAMKRTIYATTTTQEAHS